MTKEGVKLLFDELDKYDTYEENQLTTNTFSFVYGFKKDPNDNATAYSAKFYTKVRRLEADLKREMDKENQRDFEQAMARYREKVVSYQDEIEDYQVDKAHWDLEAQRYNLAYNAARDEYNAI